MAKRKGTLEIEEALEARCRFKRIYGCKEVTIGFYNAGLGNEVVDYITMDSKGILRCYEIKVTVQDLRSMAKKSWYGHYNYLVVSPELLDKVADWSQYLPEGVGLLSAGLSSIVRPKKKDISIENSIMLKESMIRSMYWKMDKQRNADSLENLQRLEKRIRDMEKEMRRKEEYYNKIFRKISEYERENGVEIY